MATETHEFLLTGPKPSDSEIDKMVEAYYQELATNYDSNIVSAEKRDRYSETLAELSAKVISDACARHILSVGSGTGYADMHILNLLKDKVTITCLEPNLGMATYLSERGFSSIIEKFEDIDASKLPKYDLIYMLWCMGHCPSVERRHVWLKNANALLNPSGKVIFDVLNIDDDYEWGPQLKKLYGANELWKLGYELGDVIYRVKNNKALSYWHYFSKKEVTELLTKENFKIDDVCYIGYGKKFGQILKNSTQGAMLFVATKK